MVEPQSVWSRVERKCMHLLQQTVYKRHLLQVHAFMIRNSADSNPNVLAKFISKCFSLDLACHARKCFDLRFHRDDSFLCNCMIKSLAGSRQFARSFALYGELRRFTKFLPNEFTFSVIAKSCGLGIIFWEGLEIHAQAFKVGSLMDLRVSTSFINMYVGFGLVHLAAMLFDEMPEKSLVTWTALICGYARNGLMVRAKLLYDQILVKDIPVYNVMIDGYVKLGNMAEAREVFDEMQERNVITWTSLIYGYCKHGDVQFARSLFDSMPEKNLLSWNTMINGYSKNNKPHEALRLFNDLLSSTCLEPDGVTIVSILPAIAGLGGLVIGNWIHSYVYKKQLAQEVNVCTALIDMYGKCGQVAMARKVFDYLNNKGTASWNSLINAYALNGYANGALQAFSMMQQERVEPNDVTMLTVLSACNHGGLIEEGKRHFESMADFGVIPKIEHYGCWIDLLGRAGWLDEAERLITRMPFEPNMKIMSSYLSSCLYYKDFVRAKRALIGAASMGTWNDGNYIMLSNLFSAECNWGSVLDVKKLMRKNGVKKEAGSSAIMIEGKIWKFIAGLTSHPQRKAIELMLDKLYSHLHRSNLNACCSL